MLKTIYEYVSAAKLDALMLKFNSFTMRKGESIKQLYMRLLKLIKDIREQDKAISDDDKRQTLLNAIIDLA